MTFLWAHGATYVREPRANLSDYFAHPYDPHARLPRDSVDAGYRHDENRLWLAVDGQTAYVGTAADLEAWPREVKPLLCA